MHCACKLEELMSPKIYKHVLPKWRISGSIKRRIMNRQLIKDSLGWGFILWLIGYLLGFVFFFVLPPSLIGWAIMPIGLAITLWVLLKKVNSESFNYYLILAVIWTAIAVAFDYLFIVKALNPADGYYKPDVYLYYTLTFISPLVVGWWKKQIRLE
jgi:uncharacterized membrane protein